ncbi:hypothetical protein [Marinobacter sp. SS21]|uniref:hypothetical protein n=1 Tax=Marinobacter sp. SS21 TaxID=2979460 RepID=UPI00232FD236|nr:hypothetical protein [Marinobacter sp. SS21]MDC0662980.1 hypothetical protein [Marinobacter sp. SS21]
MTSQALAFAESQGTFSPRRLASLCLVLACACAIGRQFGAADWLSMVSGSALVAFVALQWSAIARTYQFFALLALMLAAVLWSSGAITPAQLMAAVDRAAFFTFFLTALAVLKEAAQSSPLVRQCGTAMVQQPPGRRYLLMTLGAHLFSIMLNVGALNVLGTMVQRAIRPGQDAESRRIAAIRSRRMLTATLRGFAGLPMWSPTSVTMLLVLSGIPELSWEAYAPYGLVWCALFILWGAVLDRWSYPPPQTPATGNGGDLFPLLPLALLVALIPAIALALASVTRLDLFPALLICAPVIGLGWIACQYRRAGPRRTSALVQRRIVRSFPRTFTDQRNEVVLFASSGFIGVVLIPLIDPHWASAWLQSAGIGDAALMSLVSLTMLLGSFMGINAIITATLMLGVLQQLPHVQVSAVVQASVIAITWAAFAGASPFTASLRFISRFAAVKPLTFGIVWNGLFNGTVLLALHISLFILL